MGNIYLPFKSAKMKPQIKKMTKEKIKTRSTYADPELALIGQAEWFRIIREASDAVGIHPVLCSDHVKLLTGRP